MQRPPPPPELEALQKSSRQLKIHENEWQVCIVMFYSHK